MSTKEIGLPISIDGGIHNGTEIKDGELQLKQVAVDVTGIPVYIPSGTWESEIITIGDKVTAFHRVVKTMVDTDSNVDYKLWTRSSSNRVDWSEYVEVNYDDGKINSPVGLYAQIKVELITKLVPTLLTVDEFKDGKYNTDFVESSGGELRLKRNRPFTPTTINHGSGFVLTTTIPASKYRKLNRIRIQ